MSLVEILVVLVILVIGVFAITRLFPQGFANLNYTAAKTQANALAKQFEDYLSRNRENLPDGIVAIRRDGVLETNLSPGQRHFSTPYTDNPINGYSGPLPEDPRYSGANVARRVIGEQFKISPPTAGYGPTGETVSLYRPLFGPIYSAAAMLPISMGVSAYSGTPMQRVVCQDPPSQENREAILNLGVQGYGVDYEAGVLYVLPAPYARSFKIEFSYRTGPGAASQTVPDNTLVIPADPNAFPNPDSNGVIQLVRVDLRSGTPVNGAGSLTAPILGGVLDPGSDFLYRRFDLIPVGQAFSSNPYEFKVYDTILGLLGFNPISASIPLARQEGRGLTARIDYDVDDWEILRQDETVPDEQVGTTASSTGNGFYTIKLASGAIKRYLDVEETVNLLGSGSGAVDTTFEYQGLVRNYPAGTVGAFNVAQRPGTPQVDLIIVDLQTGYTIDSRTMQRDGNSTNGEIDYASGQILLRYVPGSAPMWSPPSELAALGASAVHFAPAGRQVRVFYRTYNDLGVAVVKPYSTYFMQPNPQGGLANLRSREFYPSYGSGYLLFPSIEHDKTVAVDYTWQDMQGRVHVETGELHRIEPPDPPAPPVSVTAPVAGCSGAGAYPPDNMWWVRVSRADQDPCKSSVGDPEAYYDPATASQPATAAVMPGSIRILGVRGVSVHTHVTWKEATRRRHMERTSIITRELSR